MPDPVEQVENKIEDAEAWRAELLAEVKALKEAQASLPASASKEEVTEIRNSLSQALTQLEAATLKITTLEAQLAQATKSTPPPSPESPPKSAVVVPPAPEPDAPKAPTGRRKGSWI